MMKACTVKKGLAGVRFLTCNKVIPKGSSRMSIYGDPFIVQKNRTIKRK